ncbi:hypothetical protein MKW98_025954 [Papaver atlanticum]|uniref:Uncharacterized protein n=1 Tax=Papaver atlanticum TaxID=357466 RepID=A0AAD4TFB7_9MAGN|nr:hypothetical protein MKW98_025954 [Papaver atlanticum]
MAAAKTSLGFFIVALIVISANLQMASAQDVECATGKSLTIKLLTGECTLDTECVDLCNEQCDLTFNSVSAVSVCVLPVVEVQVKICSCCCAF